ncbi:helix-turn-helix domain-containing protein [Streptomyces sp. BE20]|uniref:winged helix-turn-helix transcriptional regulator n=1 Tax=Streptomyces sp. BE20 TaxID=3002525 RepID=UPI002E78358E|nr:helix-turn-helix domain-containing protein [Streptomyces sp. BE20]MEE1829260.1 helix-turn-helix domain-containing protein [Streptomyces sp. BE20]
MIDSEGTPLTRAENDLFETLSARWTMHILLALQNSGECRFGEVQDAVSGISNRVLSSRLAGLEISDLVLRTVTATRPVTITYGLTAHGRRVAGALNRVRDIARERPDNEGVPNEEVSHIVGEG